MVMASQSVQLKIAVLSTFAVKEKKTYLIFSLRKLKQSLFHDLLGHILKAWHVKGIIFIVEGP